MLQKVAWSVIFVHHSAPFCYAILEYMSSFFIEKYQMQSFGKPFVVAELSGNHNGSLERALELVDLAIETGVQAIKLQTYTADSITIDSKYPEFVVNDAQNLWGGRTLYDLYQEASTPYEWHGPIFEHCRKKNIICFSTPFDEHAVDFLEQFNPPCYKIASFENNHYPLIKKVIATGKPLIISLGLCTLEAIDELNAFLKAEGAKNYIFLKCTSAYPADPRAANLNTIPFLQNRLNVNIGLSDHTMGIGVAIASVALGAQFIEKHFTDSRAKGGVDSAFSMEPAEMKLLVEESERAWMAMGHANFDLSPSEEKNLQFKRSIYVVKDMQAGEAFSGENIRAIRPGLGLPPKHFDSILGKKSKQVIKRGQYLTWDMVGD